MRKLECMKNEISPRKVHAVKNGTKGPKANKDKSS